MHRLSGYARLACPVFALLFVFVTSIPAASVAGQDAGAPTLENPAESRAAQVRALLDGSLAVDVSPQSLFDVSLSDEAALQLDATRIRALLRAADEASESTKPVQAGRKRSETSADTLRAELASIDAALWAERLELDRARLDFYSLSAERRAEVLAAHTARKEASEPHETDEEKQAREAEAERHQALEAARVARSEAERIVSEELARLISVETRVRNLREEFKDMRGEIAARRDTVLGWQRRVRDAKGSEVSLADATYDSLRRALRASRDDLSTALDVLNDDESRVPVLDLDPLVDIPLEVSTEAARERRTALEHTLAETRRSESSLREERAAALLDEINTMNMERLSLLPSLSPEKRDAITGFTAAGWDQARSEARQLSLILRYHQHVAQAWLHTMRGGGTKAISPWRTILVMLPALLATLAFVWGRRRTHALLGWVETRLTITERAERRTTPSLELRTTRILLKTHRPLEWILFFAAVSRLLPHGARELLEVQLISSVVRWTLVGSLVVNMVNALASRGSGGVLSHDDGEFGSLRLRSLRLVGRTVIAFALMLVLSARIVGEGTIYSWVFFTCWFAAIPVFLLLVRWWREAVFQRLDRLRKKTPLQNWILGSRSGWQSFVAAMIGAVQLFITGTLRLVRSWLSEFDLARRVHAYLFKREIERIGEGNAQSELVPLPPEVREKLNPEQPFERWLSCPADELREELAQRAVARRGAVIAVVAPRGMGKSSLLRAVAQGVPDAKVIECHAELSASELKQKTDEGTAIALIDDAHTLIESRIGGLTRFDDIVSFARSHSERTVWVFFIDTSIWPLLKRARDSRPMFDDTTVLAPWDERELGALFADRCQAAGFEPHYDALLDKLPPGADEIDRLDALKAKRAGYERMLWDHVRGNPGLALEAFRASLGRDKAGIILVRPLQVPDITKLEDLPDSSLFVLRAVLQLAPTSVEAIAQATRLRPEEVLQDLRFGKAQGFYEERTGRVQVAWPWLRAVSRLLERRHLLVNV